MQTLSLLKRRPVHHRAGMTRVVKQLSCIDPIANRDLQKVSTISEYRRNRVRAK